MQVQNNIGYKVQNLKNNTSCQEANNYPSRFPCYWIQKNSNTQSPTPIPILQRDDLWAGSVSVREQLSFLGGNQRCKLATSYLGLSVYCTVHLTVLTPSTPHYPKTWTNFYLLIQTLSSSYVVTWLGVGTSLICHGTPARDFCYSLGLTQPVNFPTRISTNVTLSFSSGSDFDKFLWQYLLLFLRSNRFLWPRPYQNEHLSGYYQRTTSPPSSLAFHLRETCHVSAESPCADSNHLRFWKFLLEKKLWRQNISANGNRRKHYLRN